MNRTAIALIIGVILYVLPAAADEASKTAKAEELLQIAQGDQMIKMMEPMMKGMAGMAKPDMPAEERAKIVELQRKITALVIDRLNKAKPSLAKIYSDIYTEEELDGLLAFYKSPVGKAFLEKMPEVMQRSAPLMVNVISGMQPEIKKLTEEMKQKSK